MRDRPASTPHCHRGLIIDRSLRILLVPLLFAGLLTVAAPAVRVEAGGPAPLPTVAHEVAGRVERARTFELPIPASHVALHWPGQPNAQLTMALSTDGTTFTDAQPVLLDEVGEQRGNGETYGSVMSAADARFVRVTSDRPLPRVSVLAMDSDNEAAATGWSLGATASAAAPQPAVITRAGWGATESYRFDGSGREKWPRDFFPIQKLFVHHTAGINDDPNPRATVRAIYHYHAITQGWGDIGYNFLIDEAGNVYEGRYSRRYASGESPTGEDLEGRGVTGGHALGYNAGTMGVGLLGTLTDRNATAAARDALVRLLAWKAERHNVHPQGSTAYVNPIDGTRRTFPNIAGHRDVNQTACPGDTFYASLPSLRSAVAARGDFTPPSVSSRSPANGATEVYTGTSVQVTFSEPVTGVTDTTFRMRDTTSWAVVPATVTYDAATRRATLRPSSPLQPGLQYRFGLGAGIADMVGNLLPQTFSYFTTTTDVTAPVASGQRPADGATNVYTGTTVQVTFSEPVTGVSATSFALRDVEAWELVPATVTYDAASRTATLRPSAPLDPGREYRAGLSNAVRDSVGNRMAYTFWRFTTTLDNTPPSIAALLPASGATNVSPTTSIRVTFSEPVTGVSASSFRLRDTRTWAIIPATVTLDATSTIATLRPTSPLARGVEYRAGVSADIRDLVGNPMTLTFWRFTTAR